MEKMLVMVFDDEKKAYLGSSALKELDRDGSISIYAESVIQKNADGTVAMKQAEGDYPIGGLAGTAIGGLIGLLGGPVGFAAGTMAGAMAGLVGDMYVAGVNLDFIQDVSAALTPGKYAVIAEISEEWVTPVDTRVEQLGGVVYRTTKEQFEQEREARQIAAIRAEIDELKSEHAQARADRKAKLQAKIDALDQKLYKRQETANKRLEQIKSETDAKIEALRKKAASADRNVQSAINTRIDEIRERHNKSVANLRTATAEHLRKLADKIQKAG